MEFGVIGSRSSSSLFGNLSNLAGYKDEGGLLAAIVPPAGAIGLPAKIHKIVRIPKADRQFASVLICSASNHSSHLMCSLKWNLMQRKCK